MRNLAVCVGVLATFAGSAAAAPITYHLTGTVTQVGQFIPPGVAVGDHIPITITVEASTAPSIANGVSAFEGQIFNTTPLIYDAIFGSLSNPGALQSITLDPGSSIVFDTTGPQISQGFDLTLSGALAGTLAGSGLPSSLDASRFTFGIFAVTEAFDPTYDGFSGTIDGLATVHAVPEPASLVVLAVGVMGVRTVRRRSFRT